MTAGTAEQPPEKTSRRSRADAVDEGAAPEPPKLRRRPMLIAASVLLTAVGALLGAWLLTGLSGTQSYIAVGEDIQRGDKITESDLVRTQLRADNAIAPLRWEEQRIAVGQYAAVDMAAGSLVTRDSVKAENAPKAGYTAVGLSLVPGQTVSGDLPTGSPVWVVMVPSNTDVGTEPEKKAGSVARESMSSDGTTKLVDVMVKEKDAPAVAAAGARQEVSVVLRSTEDEEASADEDGLAEPSNSPSGSSSSSADN
ncbi:SAF domain-containing protein [Janibacter sp. GS2]|uniref:SAF domain-containing protein n=1 Tax=Janibacter sp. GS2 TaxID=3442646 RepID=UPI003EB93609